MACIPAALLRVRHLFHLICTLNPPQHKMHSPCKLRLSYEHILKLQASSHWFWVSSPSIDNHRPWNVRPQHAVQLWVSQKASAITSSCNKNMRVERKLVWVTIPESLDSWISRILNLWIWHPKCKCLIYHFDLHTSWLGTPCGKTHYYITCDTNHCTICTRTGKYASTTQYEDTKVSFCPSQHTSRVWACPKTRVVPSLWKTVTHHSPMTTTEWGRCDQYGELHEKWFEQICLEEISLLSLWV